MMKTDLPDGVDWIAFAFFEREIYGRTADPRIRGAVPDDLKERLPLVAEERSAWSTANNDMKGYPATLFAETWAYLRSCGVLRSPTSDEVAAVEEALERHRVSAPISPDVVDIDRLRETFPAVHEELLRQ